jgi:cytochrome P450
LTDSELYYDPYSPDIDADPYPVWRRLRDERPLYYNEQHDFYALSRYDDVLGASTDWRRYSSARGTVLELIDAESPASIVTDADRQFDMMIFMDPPDHDLFRRLVSRAFTPRRVVDREQRLRDLCDRFLEPYRGGGRFDFVEDFAAKIPTMIIGALLGVPDADQDQLRVWGDLMMRYEADHISDEKLEAITNLHLYLEELVVDRRARPRDDMVSDLLAAQIERDDGTVRGLTNDETLGFLGLLELAGSETTARLLGWSAVLLARHPDQRAKLAESRDLIPNAVEELLRYEPPSPIQARYVTEDCRWHEQSLPAGSRLALLTGSAGRDERHFPDPDRFDVERSFDRHLTFGYGVHYCLGANLARLEAKVVLEETLARFPSWEVDEGAIEMVHTSTVRGPVHVPVAV